METEKPPDKKNLYQHTFTEEEIAALLDMQMGDTLDDEISAVRIATRRTLERMEGELETADFLKLVDRIHKGAATVASLLRTRRAISGLAADGLANAIAQIVQELATERDYKLLQ